MSLPLDAYWDVFEPLATEVDAPVCNSLADDLADIYGDLDRGAALLSRGHREAAAWEWRFHYFCHWGHHAAGAQRALFTWLSSRC